MKTFFGCIIDIFSWLHMSWKIEDICAFLFHYFLLSHFRSEITVLTD